MKNKIIIAAGVLQIIAGASILLINLVIIDLLVSTQLSFKFEEMLILILQFSASIALIIFGIMLCTEKIIDKSFLLTNVTLNVIVIIMSYVLPSDSEVALLLNLGFDYLTIVLLVISSLMLILSIRNLNHIEFKAERGERFKETVEFNGNYENISLCINMLLINNKYILHNYGDEKVYIHSTKIGSFLPITKKVIKYSKTNNQILVEAFLITGDTEIGINGAGGAALKKVVDEVIALIKRN